MDERQLLDLKKKIDSAKSESDKLKGRKEHLMGELDKKWGCTSVKEAEKKLSKIKQDIEALEHEIDRGVEEIEERYANKVSERN
jgi:predicted  nucleic acid-binding Zn-ribbon protein